MNSENSSTAICAVFRGKWSVVHASRFALDPPPPYGSVFWTVWLSRPASVIASTSCSLDCCPHGVHDNHNIVPNAADLLQGPAQWNVPLRHSHNNRTGKKDCSSLWFWNVSDPAKHFAAPSVQKYLLLNRIFFLLLLLLAYLCMQANIETCLQSKSNSLCSELLHRGRSRTAEMASCSFHRFPLAHATSLGRSFNWPHHPPPQNRHLADLCINRNGTPPRHCVTATRAFPVASFEKSSRKSVVSCHLGSISNKSVNSLTSDSTTDSALRN